MRELRGLFLCKIVITVAFWCLPLLFFPASWFRALGAVGPEPIVFARLLGAAYLGLLVGYYGGLQSIKKGEVPLPAMHMGIVSNGIAAVLLAYFGATGAWSN